MQQMIYHVRTEMRQSLDVYKNTLVEFIQTGLHIHDFNRSCMSDVDEKAMIRNQYNQIPHPAPDTKMGKEHKQDRRK